MMVFENEICPAEKTLFFCCNGHDVAAVFKRFLFSVILLYSADSVICTFKV